MYVYVYTKQTPVCWMGIEGNLHAKSRLIHEVEVPKVPGTMAFRECTLFTLSGGLSLFSSRQQWCPRLSLSTGNNLNQPAPDSLVLGFPLLITFNILFLLLLSPLLLPQPVLALANWYHEQRQGSSDSMGSRGGQPSQSWQSWPSSKSTDPSTKGTVGSCEENANRQSPGERQAAGGFSYNQTVLPWRATNRSRVDPSK